MSWLLHPEPFGPIPFRQGRECRRPASGKSLYQVWSLQLLGGVSCSSIVGLNKSHPFQQWRKKDGVSLSGQPGEHRLRQARLAWVHSLFPRSWPQQVSTAETNAKPAPILDVINVEKACPGYSLVTTNTARYLFSSYRVQFLAATHL